MAQIEQSDNGKAKKGAQKKKAIHVDFTPMVDMNMLLITFFMLCTTFAKSKTLSIALPAPPDANQERTVENSEAVHEEDAVTLIIDTEWNNDRIASDENGNKEIIYYYFGKDPVLTEDGTALAPEEDVTRFKAQRFAGNTRENGKLVYNGIRNVLYEKNKTIMDSVNALKNQVLAGTMSQEDFNEKAKQIRANNSDNSPKVTIKATNDAAWQSVISALDEMQINNISQYRIGTLNHGDTIVMETYRKVNGIK